MADQDLTPAQIESFKANGFLILRGFIDQTCVDNWRDRFWKHIGADPGDPSTWPNDYVIEGYSPDPPFGDVPPMRAAIQRLGGGKFEGGGGAILAKWPSEDTDWTPSNSGHLDGYSNWRGGFMMAASCYLSEVEHRGGGLFYWPRSHLTTQQYFLEHPTHIDSSFMQRDDWEERSWQVFSDLSPHGPEEFTGKAGDVILWHGFLCHTGSTNVRAHPRVGLFTNWYHADAEEIRYDIPTDLWKYWNI